MNKGCYINTAAILHNMATPFQLDVLDDKFANLRVKGGLNFPSMNLKNAEDEAGKLGNQIGIVSQLNCADQLALQGEALCYSEQSSKVEYDYVTFDGEASLRLNYSDVPLLLIFNPNENFNLQAVRYNRGLQKIEEDNEINGIT